MFETYERPIESVLNLKTGFIVLIYSLLRVGCTLLFRLCIFTFDGDETPLVIVSIGLGFDCGLLNAADFCRMNF